MVVASKVDIYGELVSKIVTGERGAINEVYNYITLLCKLIARKKIFKITQYDLDALSHDIASDIILNKLSKYDSKKPFSPWLRKVIANKIIDIFRKENRNKTVSLEQVFEAHSADYFGVISKQKTSTPEQLIIAKEARVYLHYLLQQLGEVDRLIVEGFYLEGKSLKEL